MIKVQLIWITFAFSYSSPERLVNLSNFMKATAVLRALDSAWKVLGGGISHYLRINFVID